jgi:hypothetical protein
MQLFALGTAMILTALIVFSSRSGNTPDESYVPPLVQDGKLQPGHAVPTSKP